MIFGYFIQLFLVKRTENQYKLRAIESIQSILGCYNSLAVLELFTSKIQVRAVFRIVSNIYHCVKSVQIWSFFWSVFSRIWTEYGISPYSVRMRQNTDQKKLRIWTHFTQCMVFFAKIVMFKSWELFFQKNTLFL